MTLLDLVAKLLENKWRKKVSNQRETLAANTRAMAERNETILRQSRELTRLRLRVWDLEAEQRREQEGADSPLLCNDCNWPINRCHCGTGNRRSNEAREYLAAKREQEANP